MMVSVLGFVVFVLGFVVSALGFVVSVLGFVVFRARPAARPGFADLRPNSREAASLLRSLVLQLRSLKS